MKKLTFLLALTIMAAIQGHARRAEYETGPFDRLAVRGDINVVYRSVPDSAGYAYYDSDVDYDSDIEISSSKGKLFIKEIQGSEQPRPLPTIVVYSDYLTSIENEGNATIDTRLGMSTPKLSLRLIGNGKIIADGVNATELKAAIDTGNGAIVLRGKCSEAKFNLTGTGVIQADDLKAETVKCTALGTGSIGCWATDKLDVKGMGSTKIYYKGHPEIKKIGGAKLEALVEQEVSEDPSGAAHAPAVTEQEASAEDTETSAEDLEAED